MGFEEFLGVNPWTAVFTLANTVALFLVLKHCLFDKLMQVVHERQQEIDDMYTQADLARQLGITRSSVNAWEMGISVPSTQYIVELSGIFKVSTDYLLGVNETASVSVAGLTEKDVQLVYRLISHLKEKNEQKI